MPYLDRSGQAIIEGGSIVIRVAIEALPTVLEGAWTSQSIGTRYKITNLDEFSRDLVIELNREEENGTTRVHKMFDAAIEEAIGQGAFGIEEHEDQEI